jgi:hypothetical protein
MPQSAEYFVQFPSAIFHRVTASDILSKEATMTDALLLEFDSKTVDSSELFDDRRARFAKSSTIDQDVRARVHELLLLMYRPNPAEERRRERRYPYPHLVRLTPVGPDGRTPCGETLLVAGNTLSEGGFGFYHAEPLPHRRMIASFHSGSNRWLGLLIDLRWCRFVGEGWYESGGKFLESVPAVMPEGARDRQI